MHVSMESSGQVSYQQELVIKKEIRYTTLSIVRSLYKNEMNRAFGHLCAHIGQTGPRETP